MASDDRDLRFEDPTPFRRREARERGQVPRSRDLILAVSLLAPVLLLRWWGPVLAEEARAMMRASLALPGPPGEPLSLAAAGTALSQAALLAAFGALPVAAVVWLACAGAGAAQTGLLLRPAALAPDLSRLGPRQGISRLLDLRAAGRVAFTVAKLCIAGAFLWGVVAAAVAPGLAAAWGNASSLAQLWASVWQETIGLASRAAGAFVLLAACDYGLQRWIHERELRMSRAEVLEEVARLEGDPDLKRRRLRAGRAIVRASRGEEA